MILKKIANRIAIISRFTVLLFVLLKALSYLAFLSVAKSLKLIHSKTDIQGLALRLLLEESGPTFIKIGQLLSSRTDVIGEGIAAQLSRLQCQVKPISGKEAISIIESSFGKPLKSLFEEFSTTPLACGSIAQVHLAVWNGQTVAVKIQRPNLQRKIKQDFAILHSLSKRIASLPRFQNLPILALVQELESSMISQLDFKQEVLNSEEFRTNFAEHTYIHIPATRFWNTDVIVMEYIDKLNEPDVSPLSQAEKNKLSSYGLKMFYKMIFVDGFIHADLHQGNFHFIENGIVLLDFGFTTRLSPGSRAEFRELFFALATNNGNVCAEVILKTASAFPLDFDAIAFEKAMTKRLNQFSGKAVNDFEVLRFVRMLLEIQREFGIRSSSDFTMTIISLLMFEGILKELSPELDFQQEAIEFLLQLQDSAYTQKQRISVFADLQERWNNTIARSKSASSIQFFFVYLSTLFSVA